MFRVGMEGMLHAGRGEGYLGTWALCSNGIFWESLGWIQVCVVLSCNFSV